VVEPMRDVETPVRVTVVYILSQQSSVKQLSNG